MKAINRVYIWFCLVVIVTMLFNPMASGNIVIAKSVSQNKQLPLIGSSNFTFNSSLGFSESLEEPITDYDEIMAQRVAFAPQPVEPPHIKMRLIPSLIIMGEPFTVEWEINDFF
ncbi:MAG: hypothetical protein BGO78_03980 [Chloroflexi bacterium 44-23]|nr:MAG: hypothetical protein BGO78_03980 [Chloroflexi bacterium 44-23]